MLAVWIGGCGADLSIQFISHLAIGVMLERLSLSVQTRIADPDLEAQILLPLAVGSDQVLCIRQSLVGQ